MNSAILRTIIAVASSAATISLYGQFTSTVKEINPDQSTFHVQDADGASGGRVHHIGGATNGTTFFAASEWGGLFRSLDSGRSWAHLPGHVPHATWDVAVDPGNANRVYATSLYDGRILSLAGISVSTDGGTTWSKPESATPPVGLCNSAARRAEPAAYGISVNAENTQNVVVGTNCGVAISNNAGSAWTFVDPTPGDAGAGDVWDVAVHHGGIIDACGSDGHRRSTDGGATWTATSALPGGRCSIAASPDEPHVLFAVVGETLRESDDGGRTWTNSFTNPDPQGRIPFVRLNRRTGQAFDLWFGDVGLWRTGCQTATPPTSGGTRRCPANAWSPSFTRDAGAHDDVGDIAFAAGMANDACPVLFSSDGGVYVNTLTVSPACQSPAWKQPDVTPHALWLMGMGGADHTGAASEGLYFGTQDNGPYSTVDAPANRPTWNNRGCCDVFDIGADAMRVLFTQCCRSVGPPNRVRTSGPGMTGIADLRNSPAGTFEGFRYPDVLARTAEARYGLLSTQGMFFTSDIAAAPIGWSQLGVATSPSSARSVSVAVTGNTPTFYVLAGIGDGRSQDRLFRFTGTASGNWQRVLPPGGIGGFGIVAVDPRDPNRILASHLRTGTPPQMILTTDGGTTWSVLADLDRLMTGGGVFQYQNQRGPTDFTEQSGYPQPTLVAFDHEDTNIVVAGAADAGVFVSVDGGVRWSLVTDPNSPRTSGRPHIPRPRFAYFDHEPTTTTQRMVDLYIGSQGRGVWRIRLTLP